MTDPHRIHDAMNRSLSGLSEDPGLAARIIDPGKETTKLKRKAPLGLLFAAALLIMSMTAAFAAGQLGLFDLLRDRHISLAPEAASLITEPTEQHTLEWEHVSLHVSEVLCADGEAAVLVDVTPVSEEYLILPEERLLESGLPETDRQIIALRTLTPSLQASDPPSVGTYWSFAPPTLQQTDHGLLVMYRFDLGSYGENPEDVSVRLRFETYPVHSIEDVQSQDKRTYAPASIAFPLTAAAPVQETLRHTASPPVTVPECGLRIDSLTMTTSALRSTVTLRYTITDRTLFEKTEEPFFCFCSSDWTPLDAGFGGTHTHTALDKDQYSDVYVFEPYADDTLYIMIHDFTTPAPLAQLTLQLE